MAYVNPGISRDLLIHPGETISDLLKERHMSQKELARRAGVSEAFLSEVIHGKKDISRGLAYGLSCALAVPEYFWLNLQAKYDAELLAVQEKETIRAEERKMLNSLSNIIPNAQNNASLSEDDLILQLRRSLRVSDLTALSSLDLH